MPFPIFLASVVFGEGMIIHGVICSGVLGLGKFTVIISLGFWGGEVDI